MYGEPDPGKIPTGSMTTFTPSRRRFGKDRSRSSNLSSKVRAAPRRRAGSLPAEMNEESAACLHVGGDADEVCG